MTQIWILYQLVQIWLPTDFLIAVTLQVEADWRMQLARRTSALADANQRFTSVESVMRRIAARSVTP